MGVTYTIERDGWTGGIQREVVLEAAFDASYTGGGETLAPADAGLGTIENVTIESGLTSGGLPIEWDDEAGVLVVYDSSHTEQTGGADLSGETTRLNVRGRS